MAPLAIVDGLFVLIGFLTPIAAVVAALGNLFLAISLFATWDAARHTDAFSSLYLAVISIALALLGPGWFSMDARLFGRREIIIPDLRRPPR
jgi:uncharacterized membrane protein YphA (DoxX/SURF4 family)